MPDVPALGYGVGLFVPDLPPALFLGPFGPIFGFFCATVDYLLLLRFRTRFGNLPLLLKWCFFAHFAPNLA